RAVRSALRLRYAAHDKLYPLVGGERQAVADGLYAGGVERGHGSRGDERLPGGDLPRGQGVGEGGVQDRLLRGHGASMDAPGVDACGGGALAASSTTRLCLPRADLELRRGARAVRADGDLVVLSILAGQHQRADDRAEHVRLCDSQVFDADAPGDAL